MTCEEGRQRVQNGWSRDGPVLDNTLKNEDFPTFGKPVMGMRLEKARQGVPRTDDSNLEIVRWTSEEDFLLRGRRLLWSHFLFERRRGRMKVPGKNRKPQGASLIIFFWWSHVVEKHSHGIQPGGGKHCLCKFKHALAHAGQRGIDTEQTDAAMASSAPPWKAS